MIASLPVWAGEGVDLVTGLRHEYWLPKVQDEDALTWAGRLRPKNLVPARCQVCDPWQSPYV